MFILSLNNNEENVGISFCRNMFATNITPCTLRKILAMTYSISSLYETLFRTSFSLRGKKIEVRSCREKKKFWTSRPGVYITLALGFSLSSQPTHISVFYLALALWFHNKHFFLFSSQLKSKIGNILKKDEVLRINLNIDGAPAASRSHTHPSHSQTSRLLTSSLSLGDPVPRATQCM